MPHYDYKCKSCDKESTIYQKISDEKITLCSSCGKESLQRLIGGPSTALRFQGSGYYITDYKNKSAAPSSSASSHSSKSDS